MNPSDYLKRIAFTAPVDVSSNTLIAIHEQHVYNIPFENLDVHYKKIFDLQLEHVYQKVVNQYRGGFCYELNLLFNELLNTLGFQSKIISSRIFDENGMPGPEYDHMSVYVRADKDYLADVGFGDLFVRPLEIKEGVQYDGRQFFKIEKYNSTGFLLAMSLDGIHFQKKYIFDLMDVAASSFDAICLDKQMNANSYFVKNTICTKPTSMGRVTIFNDKLIEKTGNARKESIIADDSELKIYLREQFGVVIN